MMLTMVSYLLIGISMSYIAKEFNVSKTLRILTIFTWPLICVIATVYLALRVVHNIIKE